MRQIEPLSDAIYSFAVEEAGGESSFIRWLWGQYGPGLQRREFRFSLASCHKVIDSAPHHWHFCLLPPTCRMSWTFITG